LDCVIGRHPSTKNYSYALLRGGVPSILAKTISE
jgi:hypothetical protein